MTSRQGLPPERPKVIAEALLARQKARGELEMVVGRVFGLCNYRPEPDPPERPDTRSVATVLVRVDADCENCNGKNAKLTQEKYTHLAQALVFGCTHNLPINSLTIVNIPDDITPIVQLPNVPQQIAPGSISTTGRRKCLEQGEGRQIHKADRCSPR